jgi:hypothetical protein
VGINKEPPSGLTQQVGINNEPPLGLYTVYNS